MSYNIVSGRSTLLPLATRVWFLPWEFFFAGTHTCTSAFTCMFNIGHIYRIQKIGFAMKLALYTGASVPTKSSPWSQQGRKVWEA